MAERAVRPTMARQGDRQQGRSERGQGRVWLGHVLTDGTGRLSGKARKRLRVLRTSRGALERLPMDGAVAAWRRRHSQEQVMPRHRSPRSMRS
jgi:hypothetical protein